MSFDIPLSYDEDRDDWMTLAEWTEVLQINAMRLREKRIQVLLQPKPRWMPARAWRWLLSQMLVIVELDSDA